MKMKKFIAVVSMVGMLAAAMTGCGSGSDDAKDADKGGDAKYAGDWDSANDITVVSREDGSGTRGAFIELFGIQEEVDGEKVDMTTTEAQITNNTSVMMTTVEGNEYAINAIEVFCYRVAKYIGSYVAAMNGVDAIAFTAGIGENSGTVRAMVLENLEYLGIAVDEEANKKRGEDLVISTADSKVKVAVIPTNEELAIARETVALV